MLQLEPGPSRDGVYREAAAAGTTSASRLAVVFQLAGAA